MLFVPRLSLLLASLLWVLPAWVPANAAPPDELLRMTEQLDQLDKLDFEQAIGKAEKCTRTRDFVCSQNQIKAARKVASGTASKNAIRLAETNLLAEQEAVESERRAMAQRQRELEEAQARQEEAEQQARRRADESQGMSTGQTIALLGTLLGQAYQAQAATRAAEAVNARRFQQQIDVGKAEVARNQQRFAEERARLEAQRTRQQQQQQAPQRSSEQVQAQQALASQQQLQQSQQQRQLVAQAEVRQAQQSQRQREQEAAATQRAQIVRQLEADSRVQAAAAQAESQNRSAQALAAAANARASPGNTSGNTSGSGASSGSGGAASGSGQDSRIKHHGTMYVVHYAALRHSRSDKNNITLVEQVTPVEWTYEVPRVSPLQPPSGRSNSVPYQVSDLLLKQMRPKFFDYLRGKYLICEGGKTPEGCYGWSVYHQIGDSAAEVQGKLNASLRSFSAPVTNDSGLDYPRSIAYSE